MTSEDPASEDHAPSGAGPFVTVAEFVLPSDLAIARGVLENEDIECLVRDELTVQVHNMLSHAVGGVKLQVRVGDAARARALLIEGGFIHEEQEETSVFWSKLDQWTRKIPLIKRIDLLIARGFVLLGLLASAIVVVLWLALRPTLRDQLIRGSWCVEEVIHDGYFVEPRPPEGFIILLGCPETLRFSSAGEVRLPGFDTTSGYGRWTVDGEQVILTGHGGEGSIFHGPFNVAIEGNRLMMRSPRTSILCSKETW